MIHLKAHYHEKPHIFLFTLLLLGTPLAIAQNDEEGSQIELPTMAISEKIPEALTSRSVEQAKAELRAVPGATTLIEDKLFRDGPVANLEDVLNYAPGVYAQSRFGGDEARISIRGSGISQTYNTRGIRFLLNGLSFSEADGNVRSQLVEPLAMRYVEVFRGANAMQYGSSFLGGAINFVTPTAYSADRAVARIEYGSYGYIRPQLAGSAKLSENLDGYASFSGMIQDGYRSQADQNTGRFYGNLGFRHNENAETRIHLSIQENNLDLPGSLTMAQVDDNPRQANTFWQRKGSRRDFELYRVDVQHTQQLAGGDRFDIGAFYQRLEMYHPLPFTIIEHDQNDTGFSFRHSMYGLIGSFDNEFIWGGGYAWGDTNGDRFRSLGTTGDAVEGARTLGEEQVAMSSDLYAQDTLSVTKRLDLVLGLQLAFAYRDDLQEPVGGTRVTTTEDYYGINPKFGFIWHGDESLQFFGNVSRSFEPPNNGEFRNASAGILKEQTGTTLELGTRRSGELLNWELAVYHAWIEDEILTIETPVGSGEFATNNATETTLHSGVELGLDMRIPLSNKRGDYLHFIGNYTYNHFVFDDEPILDDNDIPGIPRQYFASEWRYEHPSGIYFGPTLLISSDWYVDYTNTLEADSYAILGLKGGYDTKHYSVFVEGRNLTDENYASNSGLTADAAGADTGVFNPGLPASVFAGIEVRW